MGTAPTSSVRNLILRIQGNIHKYTEIIQSRPSWVLNLWQWYLTINLVSFLTWLWNSESWMHPSSTPFVIRAIILREHPRRVILLYLKYYQRRKKMRCVADNKRTKSHVTFIFCLPWTYVDDLLHPPNECSKLSTYWQHTLLQHDIPSYLLFGNEIEFAPMKQGTTIKQVML